MDITKPLQQLMEKRSLFHSEADFQFALAWEIQSVYPEAKVRLEYCPTKINSSIHIDILVVLNNEWFPIELKYKTLETSIQIEGENYQLKLHGAQDQGRYDYLADVSRIEYLSHLMPRYEKGYAIMLSNDPSYWKENNRKNTVYNAFKLSDGAEKNGIMEWAPHTGASTKKGREKPIDLNGSYIMDWKQYSKLSEANNGEFKYVVSEVLKPVLK